MRVIADSIPVEGEKPEAVELKYTRHGPVLFEDRANRKAYALRAGWMEPGGAPYLASLRMNQATTWEEFQAACDVQPHAGGKHGVGRSQRQHRLAGGRHPAASPQLERRCCRCPATAATSGTATCRSRRCRHEVNPARGFIATANHYLFPNNYPCKEPLHVTWADPFRASRIAEVLGSGRMFSVAETARLQNDDLSLPARALDAAATRSCRCQADQRPRRAICCTRWDFVLDKDSVAAGVYAMWQRRLFANTRERVVPPAVRASVGVTWSRRKRIDRLAARPRRPIRRAPHRRRAMRSWRRASMKRWRS